MTGTTPPIGLISEYETSIGPAAVAPYETPGTQAFAETVRPFVRDHNTILLSNHGIVCWADTVSHAEWFVETFETYCKTYLIAQQIGKPLKFFPENKIQELLEIKRRPRPSRRAYGYRSWPCKLTCEPTTSFVDSGPYFGYSEDLARCCAWSLCVLTGLG